MKSVTTLTVFIILVSVLLPFALMANESVPVYDLEQCTKFALTSSNRLAISQQQVLSAKHNLTKARGSFLPNLSLSRSSSTSERTDFDYEDPFSGQKSDFESKSSYSSNSINSNLVIFQGMNRFGALKSAKNSLNSAKSDKQYNKQLVVENTATAYFDLLRYKELEVVAQEGMTLAGRELEKAETLYRIGSAAKSDVLQARVRHKQTQLDLLRASNGVEQAFAQLAYTMNMPLMSKFDIDRSLLDGDYEVSALNELYEMALTNRLDLQSLKFQIQAREGDITSATSSLLPSLSLSSSYSRSINESEFRFGAQESGNLSYGYSINWNLFDRFQSLSGRSQAKANKRVAEYNLSQAELDVQLEVRQLFNAFSEAIERLKLSRETIGSTEEELRLASERFKVGAGTMLEKISAQVNLTSARADEVQAKCDILINSVKLNRAVGNSLDSMAGSNE
jgi:outer membrane protein TolC